MLIWATWHVLYPLTALIFLHLSCHSSAPGMFIKAESMLLPQSVDGNHKESVAQCQDQQPGREPPGDPEQQPQSSLASEPSTPLASAPEETDLCTVATPDDSPSQRGLFGWRMIHDSASVPYLLRGKQQFVSVRMVEMEFLAKYPNTYPDEIMKGSQPQGLLSSFATPAEARLLNEINSVHCDNSYGQEQFTTKDQLVSLEDFEKFYAIIRKHYDQDTCADLQSTQSHPVQNSSVVSEEGVSNPGGCICGWLQVNNTVVPYVQRATWRLLPLPVLRHSAGLLCEVTVEGQEPTSQECTALNEMCQKVQELHSPSPSQQGSSRSHSSESWPAQNYCCWIFRRRIHLNIPCTALTSSPPHLRSHQKMPWKGQELLSKSACSSCHQVAPSPSKLHTRWLQVFPPLSRRSRCLAINWEGCRYISRLHLAVSRVRLPLLG